MAGIKEKIKAAGLLIILAAYLIVRKLFDKETQA